MWCSLHIQRGVDDDWKAAMQTASTTQSQGLDPEKMCNTSSFRSCRAWRTSVDGDQVWATAQQPGTGSPGTSSIPLLFSPAASGDERNAAAAPNDSSVRPRRLTLVFLLALLTDHERYAGLDSSSHPRHGQSGDIAYACANHASFRECVPGGGHVSWNVTAPRRAGSAVLPFAIRHVRPEVSDQCSDQRRTIDGHTADAGVMHQWPSGPSCPSRTKWSK